MQTEQKEEEIRMKTIKRFMSSLLAIATVTAGMCSVIAEAEDNSEKVYSLDYMYEQIDTYVEEGKLTSEKANEFKESLSHANDRAYAPPYNAPSSDYLVTGTEHHIAFVTNMSDNTFSPYLTKWVDIYVNNNVFTSGLTTSNFTNGAATVTSVSLMSTGSTVVRYRIYFSTTSTLSNGVIAFTLNIPTYIYNNDDVTSDYDIHCYTSLNAVYPEWTFNASNNNILHKCFYARGDVNYDGIINMDDVTLLNSYLLGTIGFSNELDRIRFLRASDFDLNGSVNNSDSLALLSYVVNNS